MAAFKVGDVVQSFSAMYDAWYEAKVAKKDVKRGEECFFVHWKGWNKRHDTWVSGESLRPAASASRFP